MIKNSLKSLSPEQVLKVFDETNNELLRESSQPEINSEEAEITTSCLCLNMFNSTTQGEGNEPMQEVISGGASLVQKV